jgi:hypothetical protein
LAIGVIGSALSDKDDDGSATASGSSSIETSAPSSVVPAPAPTTTTAPPPPPAAVVPTTETPPRAEFAMPDVVGMDLQTAQNLIQSYGPFLSYSHDLLGSRNQVLDSNWIVCDQNIPPGQPVAGDAEGVIDFGVVKREESCPYATSPLREEAAASRCLTVVQHRPS